MSNCFVLLYLCKLSISAWKNRHKVKEWHFRVFVIIVHVVLHIHSDIVNNKQRAKCVYMSTYTVLAFLLVCMQLCVSHAERRASCLHNLTSKSMAEEKKTTKKHPATGVEVWSFRIQKDKSSIKRITDMTYLGLHQRGKIVSSSYKWSHNNSLSYFCSVPASVSHFCSRISGLN